MIDRMRRMGSALLLLHGLGAGMLGAQRVAPPRFAPAAANLAPAVSAPARRAGPLAPAARMSAPPAVPPTAVADRPFSVPLFLLSGLVGGVAGAVLGVHLAGGIDSPRGGVGFFMGTGLGIVAGTTLYALTHLGSPAAPR